MNNLPLVTVMVPCFNQSKYLTETVNSILNQSYENIEIVISDDASCDDTYELSKKWENNFQVRYFRNKVNIGRVRNYKKTLIERAKGKYVLNLDGDDMLLCDEYIKNSVSFMEENNLKLVFGKRILLGDVADCKLGSKKNKVFDKNFIYEYLDEQVAVPHLSTLYDRELAISLDFYCFDIISSDRQSILNLAFDHKIGFIDQVAGGWRDTGINVSRQLDLKKRITNVSLPYLVVKSIRGRGLDHKKLDKWSNKYTGKIIANYISMYALSGNYKKMFIFTYKVLKEYPLLAFLNSIEYLIKKIWIKILNNFKVKNLIYKISLYMVSKFYKNYKP
jgi:glycosyltransferase involved in cell wall biosynthesis